MKLLKDRIQNDGKVVSENILKVDSFLNHQIDPLLIREIGAEISRRFQGIHIDKILTVESSGIAVAVMAGYFLQVPAVFAKKQQPSTMTAGTVSASCFSFTKKSEYKMVVSSDYISKGEDILIVDDFLASGNAAFALAEIIEKAGARLAGIAAVIEKGFQDGGNRLRNKGYIVESLAVIKKLGPDGIVFQ